ncbi:serine hydrolase domain-containing protein [Maritalea porphyrae]|uniref:serine hydrolase domain-containing protein n=1 Tax=Maritalea porphyrae TaxID=880732 RepID=UPI0022AFD941|nr:serine hydrolase domain-containing protein [Maritalea porphyrae]MCZ4274149.1 serine hydrolase [Maritalea porphyrae]
MLNQLDTLVGAAIETKTFPAIEILVAKGGRIIANGVWGRPFDDAPPLRLDSVFDLASITKPVATATLIRQLVRKNVLYLSDKAARYIPELAEAGKGEITIGQLCRHTSGLQPDMALAQMTDDPAIARKLIIEVPLQSQPGQQVVYSCLGYILLGEIVECALGTTLENAFQHYVATPLNMHNTCFKPLGQNLSPNRIVPTSKPACTENKVGLVHDSTAQLLGGNSGNAGLFGTARDLHKFATALIDEGDPLAFSNGNLGKPIARTIGWEFKAHTNDDCSCGPTLPKGSIGHTGFTGTSMWIDPVTRLIVIALSNRTYFSQRTNLPAMNKFRTELHTLAATAA